ncbi:MAG: DUF3463 domain-containing protein, partial [Candidatus Acidiferrales bacterium]
KYGYGRDPRCENCMVQSGYEASAVLGGNSKFGDTWKMLQWQVSGRMGGRKGGKNGNAAKRNGNGNGNGHAVNFDSQPTNLPIEQAPQKEAAFRIL